MSLYEAKATIEKVEGAHRRVMLSTGQSLETGVHGPIKSYYLADEETIRAAEAAVAGQGKAKA